MIIQGSNNPLVIQFDASVDSLPVLVVSLWGDQKIKKLLKTWELSDMTVSGDTAICPLSEDETANFQDSLVVVEAKGLDSDGETVFWDAAAIEIKKRRDSVIRLTEV